MDFVDKQYVTRVQIPKNRGQLAIEHRGHDGRRVLDCVRERKPPFSPASVVAEFAETVKAYGCFSVTGDRYAGEWPRERFRDQDIEYQLAEHVRSDLYRDLLPLLNSGQVELLDHPRLIGQICALAACRTFYV